MPCEYARLVTDDQIFIFMYGDVETNFPTIGQLIYQKYHKPVFVITQYATHLKRISSRLINKNNLSYITSILKIYMINLYYTEDRQYNDKKSKNFR